MTKTKTTKRALIASVLSLLVCFTMLIGSTFAWFTDTASTGVNTIKSGNLKIDLVDANDNSLEGKKLEFLKANNVDEEILWEPGCSYQLQDVFVMNRGDLAIKYQIVIAGIDGDAKLNEAIDWEIDYGYGAIGTTEGRLAAGQKSAAIKIKGTMKTTAGNEYQGLTIDGIAITVVATQDTVENDSFNNTYDQNATYYNVDANGNPLISTAGEFLYFAQMVNVQNNTFAGKTVYLTNDIDMTGIDWEPIGQTTKTKFHGIFDGQNHTISNLTVNADVMNKVHAVGLFGWIEEHTNSVQIKNVTLENANISGNYFAGGIVGYINGSGEKNIITNCHVKNSTISGGVYDGDGAQVGGIVGSLWATDVSSCSVTNVTLKSNKIDQYDTVGAIAGWTGSDASVTNCTETGVLLPSETVDGLYTDGKGSYAVASADALKAVETATDKTTNIQLQGDIDMGGAELEAIFAGYAGTIEFNGNGNTITNVTPVTDGSNGMSNVGMFSSMAGTNITIKNVTIESSNVTVAASGNYGSAFLLGYNEGDVTFENVTIKNSSMNGDNVKIGLFVGYSTGNVTIKNCTVVNSTCGGRYGSCLVGQMNLGKTLTIEKTTYDSSVKACGNKATGNETIIIDGVVQQ